MKSLLYGVIIFILAFGSVTMNVKKTKPITRAKINKDNREVNLWEEIGKGIGNILKSQIEELNKEMTKR